MKKTTKILIVFFLLCGIFLLIDKLGNEKTAFGYGYDGITPPEITIESVQTIDKTPAISGEYVYGPVATIDITIRNSDGDSVWTGSPTTITDQSYASDIWKSWEIADNTITELPVGIYEVEAVITDTATDSPGPYSGTDETNDELTIKNDFADLSASFDEDEVVSKKTSKSKVKIELDDYGDATHYMISRNSDFDGASWKSIDDKFSVKLNKGIKKYKFYIKLKDAIDTVSETITKTVSYRPLRYVSTSRTKVDRGETISQKGRRFSKNSSVLLYFSKSDGSYYSPQKLATDSNGSFFVDYKANKTAGKYSWYAVDEKTGKKSNTSKYTIK